MPRRKLFPGLVFVYAMAALLITLFQLFVGRDASGAISELPALVVLAAVLVSYLANWLLLRKSRSVPFLVVFNAALFALALTAVLLLGHFSGWLSLVYAVLTMAGLQCACCIYAVRSPAGNRYLLLFEALTVLMLVFVLYAGVRQIPAQETMPIISAAVLSLGLVIYRRISGAVRASGGTRVRSVSIAVVAGAAMVLLAMFFMTYFAGPLSQGLSQLYHGFLWLLRTIANLFLKVVNFFLSLFPSREPGQMDLGELAMPEGDVGVEQVVSSGNGFPIEVVLILLALVAVALVVRFAYRHRKALHGGGVAVEEKQSSVTHSKSSLWRSLAAAFARLWQRCRLLWQALAQRNLPGGLVLSLQRFCRHSTLARQQGQTVRHFLHQLAAALEEADPANAAQLLHLADLLDQACFSAQPQKMRLPEQTAHKLRQRVKALVRETKKHRRSPAQPFANQAGEAA